MTDKENYQIKYNEFWKDLVEKDGKLDLDAVQRELFDYSNLIDNAAKVYCHVTGNQTSNVEVLPEVICSLADDEYTRASKEDKVDMLQNIYDDFDLRETFEIKVLSEGLAHYDDVDRISEIAFRLFVQEYM